MKVLPVNVEWIRTAATRPGGGGIVDSDWMS